MCILRGGTMGFYIYISYCPQNPLFINICWLNYMYDEKKWIFLITDNFFKEHIGWLENRSEDSPEENLGEN